MKFGTHHFPVGTVFEINEDVRFGGKAEYTVTGIARNGALESVTTDRDKEVALLRDVYEAARQLVRFYGIDKERSLAAGTALDNAIEAVKDFDGGNDEQEN